MEAKQRAAIHIPTVDGKQLWATDGLMTFKASGEEQR